ncbi:MAG: hypothetical protein ACYDBY_15280 [Thermoanaerobaculia bacterium]
MKAAIMPTVEVAPAFPDEFVLAHAGPRRMTYSGALRPHEYSLAEARSRQLRWNVGGVLMSIALGEQKPLTEGPLTPAELERALGLRKAASDQYERLRPGY